MDPLQLYQQLLTLLQDQFAFTVTNTLQNATINDVMTVLNLGDKGLQYMEHLTLDQNVKNTIEAKNEAMQQAIQAVVANAEKTNVELQQQLKELTMQHKALQENNKNAEELMALKLKKPS